MNKQSNIGFIGGGNMAVAIIQGLLNNALDPASIHVADPSADQRKKLIDLNKAINTYRDGSELPQQLDAIVLAVKPQIMDQVLQPLMAKNDSILQPDTLVVSIAAGVPIGKLEQWLAPNTPIVRCMPNTPALVGLGASGLFPNAQVSDSQRTLTETIFDSVGISFWLDQESDIDSVIAVSGSGPAYFFYLMECMQNTGVELGLSPEIAEKLTIQTALGAATLASSSTDKPATLRKNVTSKGGTTEAALAHMQMNNFSQTINDAMQAAVDRADTLSKQG